MAGARRGRTEPGMSESPPQTAREIAATRITSIGKGQYAKPYLEVKERLLWLRSEHPDAAITTELLSDQDFLIEFYDDKHDQDRVVNTRRAVFRARVTLPNGAQGSGHGSETLQDFGDYLEKAETKAIGRALNSLGYSVDELLDDDPELANRGEQSNGGGNGRKGGTASTGALGWTAFWKWAREEAGLESRDAIETLVGQEIKGLEPQAVQDAIKRARAAKK